MQITEVCCREIWNESLPRFDLPIKFGRRRRSRLSATAATSIDTSSRHRRATLVSHSCAGMRAGDLPTYLSPTGAPLRGPRRVRSEIRSRSSWATPVSARSKRLREAATCLRCATALKRRTARRCARQGRGDASGVASRKAPCGRQVPSLEWRSRSLAMVEVQHAAETLMTYNAAAAIGVVVHRRDEQKRQA